MSKTGKDVKEGIEVDINVILRDYAILQRYAENISSALSSIVSELSELTLAKESINKLSQQEKVNEALISLDRSGYAYMRASIVSTKKVLVNIGANYYIVTDVSKAIEILDKRINELMDVRRKLEGELMTVSQKIEELKQILAQIQATSPSK